MILGGSISQNNFMGTGNHVTLGLTRSEYQSHYTFSFIDPYWTVDGVSLGYNAFYRKTNYDKLNYDVSSYAVDSAGGGITMGYPISEVSRLTFGLSAQSDKVKPGTYPAVEIQDFITKEGKSFTNFKATAGWSTSTLNRGMLPTAGASQSLFLEATVPGSDLKFYRLDYDGQYFKGLWGDHVLRFHTRLGYAESYGSTSKLPFYENYYAGGFDSVRGFRMAPWARAALITDTVRTVPVKSAIRPGLLHFGGNVLIEGGVEWIFRCPLSGPALHSQLCLWDVGNVLTPIAAKNKSPQ